MATFPREMQAVDSVVSDIDYVAILGQRLLQVLGKLELVFDDQNPHLTIIGANGRASDYETVIKPYGFCRTCLPIVQAPRAAGFPKGTSALVLSTDERKPT